MDFSLLSLFHATREQIMESRRRTHELWGKGLSLEKYFERDTLVEESECGKDGKFITWVLAPRSAPQTLDFICACETFRRRGLVRSASGVTDAVCYGIASVFTPPQNRRKGYARHMMRLLHWVLARESDLPSSSFPKEWGMPPDRTVAGDASFSILYSDVGAEFYRACGPIPDQDGWVADKPISTEWSLSEYTNEDLDPRSSNWIWLDDKSLIESWKADAGKIKEELAALQSDKTVFTFLPDEGVAEYQYQRSKGAWSQLEPIPKYWGLLSVTSGSNANIADEILFKNHVSYATWAFDFFHGAMQALIITRLRVAKEDFPELLKCIMAYAKEYGLPKVEIWNLESELEEVARQTGGQTITREEHLPAVKWYGANSATWILNEKFCWC